MRWYLTNQAESCMFGSGLHISLGSAHKAYTSSDHITSLQLKGTSMSYHRQFIFAGEHHDVLCWTAVAFVRNACNQYQDFHVCI